MKHEQVFKLNECPCLDQSGSTLHYTFFEHVGKRHRGYRLLLINTIVYISPLVYFIASDQVNTGA